MINTIDKTVIASNDLQDVLKIQEYYYINDKKDRICVLPYSISADGLLDKIGIMDDINYLENEKVITIINDYITSDDDTDLLAANRILYELTNINITDATKWCYIGNLYSNLVSENPLKIYAVNVTNVNFPDKVTSNYVEDKEESKRFRMEDASRVLKSDDMLFLSSYFRLFQHLFVSSINKQVEPTVLNVQPLNNQ